jgi:hypothetical protein
MARNQKDFTYDHATLLKDAGLVATSAAATVASSARQLDLGPARIDGRVIVDISAVEIDTGNEKYEIEAQVSNTSGFGAGIVITGLLKLGHSSVSNESASSGAGRRELHITNEVNGVTYRYLRLFTRVGGTVATGINYSAFFVPRG